MGKQIKRRPDYSLIGALRWAVRLQPGVFTTGAGLLLAGVGGAAVTPAWTVPNFVGNASIILGVILIVWGIRIHGLHVWQPWWRGKPFPFTISGWTLGEDYAPGTVSHGIRWEQGFAHSSITITNENDHTVHEVEAIINPEYPIIFSSVQCDFGDCKIGPLLGKPKVTIVVQNPSGQRLARPHDPQAGGNYQIDPAHRLYCDKLPSGTTVNVEFATVVPVHFKSATVVPLGGKPTTTHLWQTTRRDPRCAHVRIFWKDGDQSSHAEGITELKGRANDRKDQ